MLDERMMRELAAGRIEALAVLYDRLGNVLFAVASRVCGDAERASGVVEQVFLELWERRERYRAADSVPAGALIERCRQLAREACGIQPTAARWTGFERADGALASPDVMGAIRGVVDRLPAPARAAIELAYFEGLSVQVIAERTQTTVDAVLGHLRTALDELRPLLAARRHGE